MIKNKKRGKETMCAGEKEKLEEFQQDSNPCGIDATTLQALLEATMQYQPDVQYMRNKQKNIT